MPEIAYPVELRITYYEVSGRNTGGNLEVIDLETDRLLATYQAELADEITVYAFLLNILTGLGTYSVTGHEVREAHRRLMLIMHERYHLED